MTRVITHHGDVPCGTPGCPHISFLWENVNCGECLKHGSVVIEPESFEFAQKGAFDAAVAKIIQLEQTVAANRKRIAQMLEESRVEQASWINEHATTDNPGYRTYCASVLAVINERIRVLELILGD